MARNPNFFPQAGVGSSPGDPAFEEAVSAAVERRIAELDVTKIIDEKLAEAVRLYSSSNPSSTDDLVAKLAAAIRDMSDEGLSYRPVRLSPDEVGRRAGATTRLRELLAEARDKKIAPRYRVRDKVWLDAQLIEPFVATGPGQVSGVVIAWYGVPNLQLAPLNDIARKIFAAFRETIGAAEVPAASPKWVSPGGLVIEGAGPDLARRARPIPTEDDMARVESAEELPDLPAGAIDPRATTVHILGTIVPPAKQNYYGLPRELNG